MEKEQNPKIEEKVNKKKESPDISKNLIMSVIVGAILGLIISLTFEYFDNTLIDFLPIDLLRFKYSIY